MDGSLFGIYLQSLRHISGSQGQSLLQGHIFILDLIYHLTVHGIHTGNTHFRKISGCVIVGPASLSVGADGHLVHGNPGLLCRPQGCRQLFDLFLKLSAGEVDGSAHLCQLECVLLELLCSSHMGGLERLYRDRGALQGFKHRT